MSANLHTPCMSVSGLSAPRPRADTQVFVVNAVSADLDVGRRPTDNCAEICEGTVGRSLPIYEKGPAASPGKLQPLPPLSSLAHPQANEASVTQRKWDGVEGSAAAFAKQVGRRLPPLAAAVGGKQRIRCNIRLHPLTHLPLTACSCCAGG